MAKLPTDIRTMARAHTETALRVLAKIVTAEDAPHSARVTAAIYLINRGWGQPAQTIDMKAEVIQSVIRAPQIVSNPEDWTKKHVPEQHRTEH
jgi:hypothetical protein